MRGRRVYVQCTALPPHPPRRTRDASTHPLSDHRRAGTGNPCRGAVGNGNHGALPRSDRRARSEPRGVHGHLPGTGACAGTGRGHAARSGHRPRSAAWHPVRGQGPVRRGGPADDRGHPPSRRQRAGLRLRRRRSVDASRDGAARQDDHGAVRVRRRRHQHRSGNPAQSVASRASSAGRVELGHRRRGGGGNGADGAGLRYRRVGPDPREHVRDHRSENDGGTGEPRRHLSAEPKPRQRRSADPRRGRRRDRLRSDTGPGSRRCHDPRSDPARRDERNRARRRRSHPRRAPRSVLGRL